jgi:hypothetical protein
VQHVCRGLYAEKRSLKARLGIGDYNSGVLYREHVLNSNMHGLLVANTFIEEKTEHHGPYIPTRFASLPTLS